MFTLIEALNYRCLRYISRPLRPFQILIGPNASGKTTFLDVIAFLGRMVSDGLEAAIDERTKNFNDLLWNRQGEGFELAVEAAIPKERLGKIAEKSVDTVRYEIVIGFNADTNQVEIRHECVRLVQSVLGQVHHRIRFPEQLEPADTLTRSRNRKTHLIISKDADGDRFLPENRITPPQAGMVFGFGKQKSALGSLPPDESLFPVSLWLKTLFGKQVQSVVLNSLKLRQASPPAPGTTFRSDGSNLPWMIEKLQKSHPETYADWLAHIRTALEIADIRIVEREDDRHKYLMVMYLNGVEVPSWTVSDGTLRLLALTLMAYLQDFRGVCLIEEPENGIHPRAVETVYQSLSSVYETQVLLTTHSPVILSVAKPEDILCFSKRPSGETDVVAGNEHPKLRKWKHEVNLGVLYASGVLG